MMIVFPPPYCSSQPPIIITLSKAPRERGQGWGELYVKVTFSLKSEPFRLYLLRFSHGLRGPPGPPVNFTMGPPLIKGGDPIILSFHGLPWAAHQQICFHSDPNISMSKDLGVSLELPRLPQDVQARLLNPIAVVGSSRRKFEHIAIAKNRSNR